MILAGDVGGTKTLIGLFEVYKRRPVPVDVRTFQTMAYPGLPAIITEFFAQQSARPSLTGAAFGVAGPVINQSAKMTNVPWVVDAAEIAREFGLPRVQLLNDLESMAHSLPVLLPDELKTLQSGNPHAEGTVALIAAGTGLGQALLHHVGDRELAIPSEGGHADFAARTEREMEFARFLRERYGRSEIEHVLSGPGLLNLSNFTHLGGACVAMDKAGALPETPAAVGASALAHKCSKCVEALQMFVSAYGAAAGNLALTAMATGGVYVGGGVAPRVLPAMESGEFVQAFSEKGPMRSLLEGVPVNVILNPGSAMLGAAVCANRPS